MASHHGLNDLNELEFLDLSHNELTDIVDCKAMKEIKCLKLSHNKISKVPSLLECKSLYKLDLCGNSIKQLDKVSFTVPN